MKTVTPIENQVINEEKRLKGFEGLIDLKKQ